MTTQYLDEAAQLADQISVIDVGRVIADGSPDPRKSRIASDRIEVIVRRAEDVPAAAALVSRVTGADTQLDPDTRRISTPVRDRAATLTEVVRGLHDAAIEAENIALRRPTLDEVFLHITGKRGAGNAGNAGNAEGVEGAEGAEGAEGTQEVAA